MRRHGVEIYAREARVDVRPALQIRALTSIENVIERAEALGPVRKVAIHLQQIAVVLQPLLEAVAREQFVQVAALDRVRHALEPPIPTRLDGVGVAVLAEQLRDQLAALDAVDGLR